MSSTAGVATSAAPAVELSGVTKRFGAIVACDEVDLVLWRGRIHGILGENGAGKSTLMKVLIGLVPLDSGTVSVDGERVIIRDARRCPIRNRDGSPALQPRGAPDGLGERDVRGGGSV